MRSKNEKSIPKAVTIDGKQFISFTAAAKHLGISRTRISQEVKHQKTNSIGRLAPTPTIKMTPKIVLPLKPEELSKEPRIEEEDKYPPRRKRLAKIKKP